MHCSTPGSSVLDYLPEFAQMHVHWVGVAIWPSHPLPPLLLLPSVLPSIRVFSSEPALRIRWPEYYFRLLPSCCCLAAKSCLTLCDRTDRSTPGSPVLPHYPELTQTHVHWVSGTIQPSHPLLLLCPPAFNLSQHHGLFQWLFASGGQSIGASASASILPVNFQGWFPLGLTGLISSPSKGLSRVFSSTTVQKQWLFGTQPSSWSNSHIYTWLLEKP